MLLGPYFQRMTCCPISIAYLSHSTHFQVRNLSRMVWIHVSLPAENGVASTRIPNPELTHADIKCQKIEVLRYCLAFTYAVKHYLRGEDGADYGDLAGVLPPSFAFHTGSSYTTKSPVSFYATMQSSTPAPSINDRHSIDATKRVKRKRSKKNTGPQANTPGTTTPLLSNSHQTVEFRPHTDQVSMPLPLMFVL